MPDFVPSNLWDAFLQSAGRDPAAEALWFPKGSVGFGELQRQAEACAAWLASLGVVKGDTVALQLPKRAETYALWLACLRQGAPYVFLDPRNPEAWTARILDRVRPRLLVTTTGSTNPHGHTIPVRREEEWQDWHDSLESRPPVVHAEVRGLHPAYIMFTSGSTGEPKGAVIPHHGALSLMQWGRSVTPPGATRFANLNPLHFDNSVFDLYCGLANGATLVPVDTAESGNPVAWVRRLREGRAAVVFAVPTLFLAMDRLKLLKPPSLPEVQLFVFGGEGFPIEALRTFHDRFQGHAKLLNVYGPTETSCICSSIEIDAAHLELAGGGLASIGRLHPDFDHYVLDENGNPAATGELWIGGSCVGLGYWGNAEETARRFCQDPRQDCFRSIWYRSGDLVRKDAAGLLWFQGRADNQVKIRGYRIELEQVEQVVEQIPGVSRAVCVALTSTDGLELRLAFVAEGALSEDDIRDQAAIRLPHYMQPTVIRRLEILPENANGKIDRKAVRTMMEQTL